MLPLQFCLMLAAPLGHESYAVRESYSRTLDSFGPMCLPVAAVASRMRCAETAARGKRLWSRHDGFSRYLVAYGVIYCDYGSGARLPAGFNLDGYGDLLIVACLDIVGCPPGHYDREWLRTNEAYDYAEKVNVIRETVRGVRDEFCGVRISPRARVEVRHTAEPPR